MGSLVTAIIAFLISIGAITGEGDVQSIDARNGEATVFISDEENQSVFYQRDEDDWIIVIDDDVLI